MAINFNKQAFASLLARDTHQKQYTILIVDDEKANLKGLVGALEREYHLLEAINGKQALAMILELPPPRKIDIIITDQRMPEMTGIELLEHSIPLLPHAIRILLTGYTDVESIINSINKGQIYKFVTKPVDPRDLKLTLKRALESYELQLSNLELLVELKTLNAELEEKVAQRTKALNEANHIMSEELHLASDFQKASLVKFPTVDFLSNAIVYQPWGAVSGDNYDFNICSDGSLNIFIGDAVGHGVAAALMIMMTQIALDSIDKDLPPAEILNHLNNLLNLRNRVESFITCAFLRISPKGEFNFCLAGHPPPVIFSQSQLPPLQIKPGGPLLGMLVGNLYEGMGTKLQLQAGDRIFICTDGIIEWYNNKGLIFGERRLVNCLQSTMHLPLQEWLENLVTTTKNWSQEPCTDDYTLLAFEYSP